MKWLENLLDKNEKYEVSFYMVKKKVFVGLSGGVDSSVSAALLKEQGYEVTGVFIKVWQPDFLACTWKEDRLDAIRVAAHLDIPFMTLDLEKEYKESVVNYMVSEYSAGRTPNPDVMCNKTIKFGAFLKKALELGADYVATGHYARNIFNEKTKLYEFYAGVDSNKDQSYFLWTLNQEQLKHILFPVGEYEKPQVREIAKKFGLLTATKKDSQGLCFVGKLDMKDFLKHFIPEKRGDVLNEKKEVIGYHDGAQFYTIGQRHGFMITEKTSEDDPFYVIGKDIENNTVTVSHRKKEESSLGSDSRRKTITLANVNWTRGESPENNSCLQARVRYRQPLQEGVLKKDGDNFTIEFKEPQIVDNGQSAVLYDDSICLGGGIVET